MAVSKYIQQVKRAAGGRDLSIDWYRRKIRELGRPNSDKLVREGKRRSVPYIGKLNMFFYDPKLKQKLPYYDIFPLVLPLKFYSEGFLGINFHYLPIPFRMRLLDKLMDYSNNDKLDETTRLNVTYNNVSRIKLIKPTLHKYLKGYVQSQFRRIDADEFVIATLLPVQQFKKASSRKVWSDSRRAVL
tara:strand:+ start:111 stop:671 length:561 start_codon:yes stop_codon:yes gene_type:complete